MAYIVLMQTRTVLYWYVLIVSQWEDSALRTSTDLVQSSNKYYIVQFLNFTAPLTVHITYFLS
jgi:hypothetical protein